MYLGEIDYDLLKRKFAKEITYRGLPKFPDAERDIAVTVKEEVTCAQIESCILSSCKAVKKAQLFDVYRGIQLGAGKKSMAFRLTFSAGESALTPEVVDGYFQKILTSLNRNLGAELR